ncbi:MAG: hypothetical protein ACON38_03945 [Akkermansiaceae bacterium]
MTRSRYGIAVLLQSFGYIRKTKRLSDITTEMHLLQDGEEILGATCWANTEKIEELSMEYWTLRRLEQEQAAIAAKIEASEGILESAQQRRLDFADASKEAGDELFQARETLFEELEKLNNARDEIMFEAQVIRRKHGALKMKAKVLLEEENDSGVEIQECREALAVLKGQFEETKERLNQLDFRIDAKDSQLATLQKQVDAKLQGSKGKAEESFAQISQANKDITKYLAELGLLQEEFSQHCRDLGRFLSINEKRPDCWEACKKRRALLEQLRVLRTSIQLNRKLVDRVTV